MNFQGCSQMFVVVAWIVGAFLATAAAQAAE